MHLELPGLAVDAPDQAVVWRGRIESLQFGVQVPSDLSQSTVIGQLTVSLDGLPVGVLRFKLKVAAAEQPVGDLQPAGHFAKRYRKAFISYSSEDRAEVLKRVQMLKANGIDFFQDILSLEPGQRWEAALYREIGDCDVFYLFWSTSAKHSPWVQKELQYAWDRKAGSDERPPEIMPIPLEGPPIPVPPDYLGHLHFNDALLPHIRVAE